MNLELELQNTDRELTQARTAFSVAIEERNVRKQNELVRTIAELQGRAAVLLPEVEKERAKAAALEAQENSPESKRELKQIAQLKAEIDAGALELYKNAGEIMRATLALFDQVKKLKKLMSKHSQDKTEAALYCTSDKNIRAAGLLLSVLQSLRNSVQVRADLYKYFPDK